MRPARCATQGSAGVLQTSYYSRRSAVAAITKVFALLRTTRRRLVIADRVGDHVRAAMMLTPQTEVCATQTESVRHREEQDSIVLLVGDDGQIRERLDSDREERHPTDTQCGLGLERLSIDDADRVAGGVH